MDNNNGEQNLSGMSTNCLILIYSNSKFKVTCKNADFERSTSGIISKKTRQKISGITVVILPFSHKRTLL